MTPTFEAEIYDLVRQIPSGRVVTYGLLARLAQHPNRARMVGRAMAHAPVDAGLPCHRVVAADGRLVPAWPEQRELLEREGVLFRRNGRVDLAESLWEEVAGLD